MLANSLDAVVPRSLIVTGFTSEGIQVTLFAKARRLGLRIRDAYQTRHTYATLALMAGVNRACIARQLEQANAAMLFKNYSKWIDGAGSRSKIVCRARRAATIRSKSSGEYGGCLASITVRACSGVCNNPAMMLHS